MFCCSFSDLLFEAAACLLLPRRKSQIQTERIQPRRPISVNHVMYAIGGMSRREASKSGEKYDPKEGKWKPIGKYIQVDGDGVDDDDDDGDDDGDGDDGDGGVDDDDDGGDDGDDDGDGGRGR